MIIINIKIYFINIFKNFIMIIVTSTETINRIIKIIIDSISNNLPYNITADDYIYYQLKKLGCTDDVIEYALKQVLTLLSK